MILGILDKTRQSAELTDRLLRAAQQVSSERQGVDVEVWSNGNLALCSIPRGIRTLDESPQPFLNEDESVVMVFEGKIHNANEIRETLGSGHKFRTECSGETLVHLYENDRERFLNGVNGKFAFALWDERRQTLVLGRDHLGVESVFYRGDGDRLVFGSSLTAMLAAGLVDRSVNHNAVLQYLLYCYNPSDETFVKEVFKVPGGHTLSVNGSGRKLNRYWRLSFAETQTATEQQYRDEVLELMRDAIRIRMEPDSSPGVFLSGGTDSSAIVSLTSGMWPDPLNTFSFRCEGRSYDESNYARFVAERFGADHTEVPYDPDSLSMMSKAVESMDEPFCDIGIEIATSLLGQAAQGKVSYVFSGEGGDELFAGHPVYVADKVASVVDLIPRPIMSPVARALQVIPDSDQKRNLQVKLKRFAYSLSFPRELLSHRWRAYYTPQELTKLCSEDFLAQCDFENMFEDMARYTREADGKDRLSRSLYSDYHTLVDFYLRRLGLLRGFSIESRLPLMDYRLVEYAARIPSSLKIKGMADTKYIYKKILEGVVPREILYDRPKLGHSVPMKNWLREDASIRDWVGDLLSGGVFKDSGLFRAEYVQRMIDAHLGKTHNNSHRLWGLSVLALWLQHWMGSETPNAVPRDTQSGRSDGDKVPI